MSRYSTLYQTHLSPVEEEALEQVDVKKLVGVVEESIAQIAKLTSLPVQEVLHIIEEVDVAQLTQATQDAIKKISNATDLCRAEIVAIFKEDRVATVNHVVSRLREESHVRRARF